MKECPERNCWVPDTTCELGNLDYRTCSRWKADAKPPIDSELDVGQVLLPWTGQAMGTSDLAFVAGRQKPFIVAIAGSESAGKTTLLASWYLLLGRGALLADDQRFSGSYTLQGWEAVASTLRWEPGQSPSFPLHTTSRDARMPGLLHLAVRSKDDRHQDFLFADAPGTWFQRWAVNSEASDADGARWLARHADAFLVVADREALSGQALGPARNGFQLLAKRLFAERRGRPLALVWTKGDIEVSSDMEDVVRQAVATQGDAIPEFTTSVVAQDDLAPGFAAIFAWLAALRRPGVEAERTIGAVTDPLFLVGRR